MNSYGMFYYYILHGLLVLVLAVTFHHLKHDNKTPVNATVENHVETNFPTSRSL